MPGPLRSLPPPSKKRKIQQDSALRQLEENVTRAVANETSLNPLADLVDLTLRTKSPQDTSKAIYALYRAFVLVIADDKLGLGGDEAAKVVKAWLWDQLNVYVDYLGGLLKDEEKTLRTSALQILLSLQKHLSASYSKSTPSQPQFHISHFRKIVSFLLLCPPSARMQGTKTPESTTIDPDVLHQFHETWFSVHDDIRWFFLRESATLLNASPPQSHPNLAANLLSILERLTTFPTESSELNAWWVPEMGTKPKRTTRKGASSDAVSSSDEDEPKDTGSDNEDDDWRKGVLPHLTRPVLVMDWVGASVDYGGTVGLLALNALFVLMKDYNLDYPSFYTRLYAFLDRDVLHLKHRARFFRMTELFLSSTHLPANLLASFIKRLSRLSLTAPPAAIVMVIPFTYNILKRHPALMTMIHRTDVEDSSDDPFLPLEPNPLNTQAQLSSLWELVSHRSHYHAAVSTLAKIFSEAFTKPSYAMEDFLDHTYSTLFETEANRKIKKEPALALELGKKIGDLFPDAYISNTEGHEDEVRVDGDVVSDLWVFS
ncbi:hypothetical protein Hypma_005736 [Hypsizygus marmoreus]|uniref:CCAAT-binding factor domain-containing protein n=1 Tax=Hypsizygus marmoreus TaxID=39966 RepID=A0A369KB03_HYPMA|nr:hypothetical protein Hypma_005736 [Hypsizygus marmoreus]